jgi:hypothetical protein
VLLFGDGNIGGGTASPPAAPHFLDPGYSGSATAPTTEVKMVVPYAGTLRNLFIKHNAPTGATTETLTYTVRVNGADTALVVTLGPDDAEASNTVDSVAVAQGDDVSIKIGRSASIGTGNIEAVATLELA